MGRISATTQTTSRKREIPILLLTLPSGTAAWGQPHGRADLVTLIVGPKTEIATLVEGYRNLIPWRTPVSSYYVLQERFSLRSQYGRIKSPQPLPVPSSDQPYAVHAGLALEAVAIHRRRTNLGEPRLER